MTVFPSQSLFPITKSLLRKYAPFVHSIAEFISENLIALIAIAIAIVVTMKTTFAGARGSQQLTL
jgi:hypothetical protein